MVSDRSFETHVQTELKSGRISKVVASDSDYVIGLMPEKELVYGVVYDTLDGHEVRVPLGDVRYMLSKSRPIKAGERVDWYKSKATGGVYQSAPSGSVPAYSEVPVTAAGPAKRLAISGGTKQGRRKRGARGARRKTNA